MKEPMWGAPTEWMEERKKEKSRILKGILGHAPLQGKPHKQWEKRILKKAHVHALLQIWKNVHKSCDEQQKCTCVLLNIYFFNYS